MADTVNGSARLRAWPRRRGRGGTLEQKANRDKFMNAQRATKYFAPQMYKFFMDQVAGSPLLPRDVMTMMLYNRLYAFDLDDGRTLWPMPAVTDVSETLDVIAKIPGQTIVRGPDGWMPVTAPGPSLMANWTVIHDETLTVGRPSIDVTGLGAWNEFLMLALSFTAANSGVRYAQVSQDNGATWFTASGDYEAFADNGTRLPRSGFSFHDTATTGARGGRVVLTGNQTPMPMTGITMEGARQEVMFMANDNPINAIRFRNSVFTNINNGRFILAAR